MSAQQLAGTRRLLVLAVSLTLVALMGATRAAPAAASARSFCSGEALAEGANWSVCWEVRANEGLAITHAFYTKSGFDRRVLSDATVAQVFVPYEVGAPRYHDVAYGLGAAIQPLDAARDCVGGTLLAGGKVCREVGDRGLAERFCAGACRSRRGRELTLWSSSQMGAYNYLTRWSFHDDGTIEPAMGLAGVLQFGPTAHVHNVYWRLDVDIDDPGRDRVEEFTRISPAWSDGSVGAHFWTPLLGETYRPTDLFTFRKWRVIDVDKTNAQGVNWGYELVPSPGSGSLRTTAAEGFSRGELWVTRARSGERFVSTETQDLLSTYITGDSVEGEDIVLWYAMHEYHEVRNEDAPYMPVEWMSFSLRPRGFFDQNPLD